MSEKEDWSAEYIRRIEKPSVFVEKPYLPSHTSDPEIWKNYRKSLLISLEISNRLDPIFSDLIFIDKLILNFSYNKNFDDKIIMQEFLKILEEIIDENYYSKKKKQDRNKRYAKNLILTTKFLLENDMLKQREEFFKRARFPMSILQEKDITLVVNKFIELCLSTLS
ncbi:hypothetical protein C2G38_2182752 [Gigaspora rosea]|uniref:Uncharacterized protein n=1 Tax=Gigaspora rosea TaxID=44941 RepID=A0A397VAP3_9GLOM|nr:hypothetical protein C2G38_2182752 [Gigaspora rosea]